MMPIFALLLLLALAGCNYPDLGGTLYMFDDNGHLVSKRRVRGVSVNLDQSATTVTFVDGSTETFSETGATPLAPCDMTKATQRSMRMVFDDHKRVKDPCFGKIVLPVAHVDAPTFFECIAEEGDG